MFNRIHAAVEWGNGKVYLFGDEEYSRYDVAAHRVDAGWPKPIAEYWNGLWDRDIDTAVNWGDGKVYFFRGTEYVRYDVAQDRVEADWPKKITDTRLDGSPIWEGLFDCDIDAAMNWWNGKVYFFKSDEYVRYDIAKGRVEQGWPKKIGDNWHGVWDRDIDAAVNWGDGKAYFFKGSQYIRFDIASNQADLGPLPIPPDFTNLSGRSGRLRTIAWGQRVSEQFRERVVEIAAALETEPSFLMAAMAFETGRTFSPSTRNPVSGAVGLIQFMPATAIRLGASTAALAAMSAEDQLDFVERYFMPNRRRLRTLADVYMAVLWPAAVGQAGDFILFSKPSKAYQQNAGLDTNKDGAVSKEEAAGKVRGLLYEGLTVAG